MEIVSEPIFIPFLWNKRVSRHFIEKFLIDMLGELSPRYDLLEHPILFELVHLKKHLMNGIKNISPKSREARHCFQKFHLKNVLIRISKDLEVLLDLIEIDNITCERLYMRNTAFAIKSAFISSLCLLELLKNVNTSFSTGKPSQKIIDASKVVEAFYSSKYLEKPSLKSKNIFKDFCLLKALEKIID